MTALELYKILPVKYSAVVAKRTVALAGYPADTAFDDVIDHDDHPALVEALRDWWHDADAETIAHSIEQYGDQRAREVAVLLCAESVSRMTDDSRVAECRRVRLAWVRGEATDKQRMEAFVAANFAARDTDRPRTARLAAEPIMGRSTAGGDIVSVTVWGAAFSAAWSVAEGRNPVPWPAAMQLLAPSLLTLFPYPARLDWRDALSRWDDAVFAAQQKMERFSDGAAK